MLSVGAIEPAKGHVFLVRSLARISPGRRPPLEVVADRAVELERCYLEELARRLGVDLRLRLRVAEEELVAAYRRARARGAAPTSSHTGRGRTSPRASRDTSRRWCGGAEGSSSWQRGRQVARAWEYYRELELRVTRYRERLAPVLLGARAPRRTGE